MPTPKPVYLHRHRAQLVVLTLRDAGPAVSCIGAQLCQLFVAVLRTLVCVLLVALMSHTTAADGQLIGCHVPWNLPVWVGEWQFSFLLQHLVSVCCVSVDCGDCLCGLVKC